jgi:SAM-dependent methyltransferase
MAAFQDHFSARAQGYAAHRPGYPRELAELLARLAPRRGLAWDAGCGSGQLAVLLAELFARVVATDASAEQLRHAPRRAGVAYLRARAEANGLAARTVDLACAAQAAHWFDLPAYFAEVRRVAGRDAIVALVCYGQSQLEPGPDEVLQRFHGGELGPHWPPERAHAEDGYRSLWFPFEELEAPALELRALWSLGEFLGYSETWSGLQRLERAEGRAPIEAFRRELSRAWGDPDARRVVRWPLGLRIGRADRPLRAGRAG